MGNDSKKQKIVEPNTQKAGLKKKVLFVVFCYEGKKGCADMMVNRRKQKEEDEEEEEGK
ncbi:hypothetical protein RFI_21851 [Reticulomyxa filosa]|uniref:Uncharacterized protein n=1 Tax=Reticulomyxa filosa TaxID=46433 RepID=X6MNE0_RETFI|nr:hypothetical protein RFI_21851 [Reticulomyxa filosa]|eukprot:ETO15513.1 hypothetical protein RFI_21851 [Reticulomyxa filosa]